MSRQFRKFWAVLLIVITAATGCHPTQPFYFREDGDLSHYLESATQIEHPDYEHEPLAEVTRTREPLTLSNSEDFEIWDLTLEDCMSIALQNSKVIKSLTQGTRQIFDFRTLIPDAILARPDAQPTIYDPALFETNPQSGVEAALSEFDAQFTTQAFWQKTDRPQNINTVAFPFVPVVLMQDLGQTDISLSKKTAWGGTYTLRSQTIYDNNNRGFGRNLPSDWYEAVEAEARLPLMRNRGTQINRLPVVVARINNDVSLAEFESNVRNFLFDVETTYWDLNIAYRALETAKTGRDSALGLWRSTRAKLAGGTESAQQESQVREQYFSFRAQVESTLRDVYSTENNLRFLMGLSSSDGRLIRPIDDPTTARVAFDWNEILPEALYRTPELRRQQWLIKRGEMQLIAARHQLLPQVNLTLLYRWLGLGDDFGLGHERNGINFPNAGSQAIGELTGGNYQESRVGVEFVPTKIGARRELAGIRNAQLNLARQSAVLEEMELSLSHTLAQAVRDLDTQYALAQTHFNRLNASEKEVESTLTLFENGKATLDLTLDAQRRRAQAQIDYYRAVGNYNKSIANVHFRKGSLMEYCGVQLAEGPWPKKAYWDALGHARERDASYYLDYGWTRPNVISQGAVNQQQGTDTGAEGATPFPATGERTDEPKIEDATPEPVPPPITLQSPAAGRRFSAAKPTSDAVRTATNSNSFDWGELGLNPLRAGEPPVRTVGFEQ
jgi:outer membrane protein TolC